MDVAMSISSAMQELCDQRPDITRLELMEITRKKVHPPLYEAVRKKAHTDE